MVSDHDIGSSGGRGDRRDSHNNKKQKPNKSPPSRVSSLQQLAANLELWILDPRRQVPILSIDGAKDAVSTIMSNGDDATSVTYDKSLYTFWDWFCRSRELRDEKTNLACQGEAEDDNEEDKFKLRNRIIDFVNQIAHTIISRQSSVESLQVMKFDKTVDSAILPHQHYVGLLKQLLPDPSMAAVNRSSKRELRRKASILARELFPYVEHDDGTHGNFGFYWLSPVDGRNYLEETGNGENGLTNLIFRLWECATLQVRAVTLSLRIKITNSSNGGDDVNPLNEIGLALDEQYNVSTTICPTSVGTSECGSTSSPTTAESKPSWSFGPPGIQPVTSVRCLGPSSTADGKHKGPATAAEPSRNHPPPSENARNIRLPFGYDPRFYLIIGTPGGLTKSHWDRGVQTVLYHTVAGVNHVVALPREVAGMLLAVEEGGAFSDHHRIENNVLQQLCSKDSHHAHDDEEKPSLKAPEKSKDFHSKCQPCHHRINHDERNLLLRTGTFEEGETMLILPGGGHAILTGCQGKVIIANEWHWQPQVPQGQT